MNGHPLFHFEVSFTICGMTCRQLVKTSNEQIAKEVTQHYLESAGMKDAALAISHSTVRRVEVLDCTSEAVAKQNRAAASSVLEATHNHSETIVVFDEDHMAFAVKCNGEVIDYFPTHVEALRFANRHDHVTPKLVVANEPAAA